MGDPEIGGDPNRPGLDLLGDHAPDLNPGAGDIGLDLCPDTGKGQFHTPNPGLGRGVTDIDGTSLGLNLGAQRVTRTGGETAGATDTSHPHRQEEVKLIFLTSGNLKKKKEDNSKTN